MASLNSFLRVRQVIPNENNMEAGEITIICPGTQCGDIPGGWQYTPRTSGTLIMEAWGAGGSTPRMCCCGSGIPANTGSYVKKVLNVNTNTSFAGKAGIPCWGVGSLCTVGCSSATCWCWTCAFDCLGNAYNGCICAEGGTGGVQYCTTGTAAFCCFYAGGFCGTKSNYGGSCTGCDYCGWICNAGASVYRGQAYISTCNCICDVALPSNISCVFFGGCDPCCAVCHYVNVMAVPPGLFNRCAGKITYLNENDNEFASWSGMGKHQYISAISSLSRFPAQGIPWTTCCSSNRACGCYEAEGCGIWLPIAFGGSPGYPCAGVRDEGMRGGLGAVKFTLYPCCRV